MQDWWRGSVTYQVYPRSFQDDTADGVGDLPGITRRLPYLADLGVDAVWLSPFFRSPMKDMGYDVSDYCDVDPVFGTLADFDSLVARAHGLGLKVIIDQVLSHSSDQHPAFTESRADRVNPKADWYVWADPRHDGSPPSNWLSVFGGSAWAWDARRKQYYLHNFLTSQPDLNYHNPAVQDWALGNLRFWLERGVDGFRFDTVNYFFHDPLLRDNPADFRVKPEAEGNPYGMQYHLFDKNQPANLEWMERIRTLLDEYGAASVGEMGESHHAIRMMGDYTAPGRLHQCYSFELMGYEYSAAFFRGKLSEFFSGAPDGWPMWAFSNHDVVRHVSRWAIYGASQDALAKQAGSLLLSFEGSICLWQGEELGQTDTELSFDELTDPQGIAFWPEPVGRDNTRTPMVWDGSDHGGFSTVQPWLPVKPLQLARHVAGQAGVAGSVLEHYREVIAFRKGSKALGAGRTRFLDVGEPVLGFVREAAGESLLCLFNLSPVAVSLHVSGTGGLVGPSLAAAPVDGRLVLGPNGVAFLAVTGDDVKATQP
ncbi:MAG: alpha-glucosidase family protein [Tabrizicola sp.]|uniref:alpha-glucosidase family protein n=1 Tax=Tabrizicola sp. TaxID=2005166 RepID=UPI002733973C|nr:alpha-glucosidase family protein [Tabrizicola sp.]MDP3262399.1 alpha-glucosidase family protein [Tabrizicola sp.]MDP3647854.1 alpha-glucosidase family protein [Paracoccaceae bacterium]MDZ4068819.1 alpha-glucosidase family protein [Tabrizicola sp.]